MSRLADIRQSRIVGRIERWVKRRPRLKAVAVRLINAVVPPMRRLQTQPIEVAARRVVDVLTASRRGFRPRWMIAVAESLVSLRRLSTGGGAALPALLPLARPGQGITGDPPRIIVMLVVSELWVDPRVRREARALADAGYPVRIVYPDYFSEPLGLAPLDWGPGISFRPLPGHYANFIHSFPWMFERAILTALLDERPFAIHCHDLSVALIGLAAARRLGCYCVCDFHEWYSENVSWNAERQRYEAHPRFKSLVYRAGEMLVMHRASAVITVCESIANELSSWRYLKRRPVQVVRNIPELPAEPPEPDPPLRESLRLADNDFVLLWQGGVGPTRLIEPIIEAVGRVARVHFVIRGPSIASYREDYLALAAASGAAGRVHCLDPVPSERVVAAAGSADAGVWSLPRLSKNFYYALPNKIFEYIAAGLPVLGADFPEARRLILGGGLGLCFDPYDPDSIAAVLSRLVNEPGLLERLRANARSTLATLREQDEWSKVVAIYRELESGSHR